MALSSRRVGGKDVFVHISAVERAGLSSLNEGQVVEYEEVANKGKTSAKISRFSADVGQKLLWVRRRHLQLRQHG